MINTPNIEQAKKLIKSLKEKPIIVKAQAPEFNRKMLEHGNFDILVSIESSENKPDNVKYLSSGLNHVLAKIAAKNKVAIGIDLKEISHLEKEDKAIILARIRQNIKLCRKAKAKLKIINYKDKRNLTALLISLGASTQQAKETIDF